MANYHTYTNGARSRQVANATGTANSQILISTDIPTLATDGYATNNQRYAHIVINTFPNLDNNAAFSVWGYNTAFDRWGVLTRHASGFKNIYVLNNGNQFILQHSQDSRPCARSVLEIDGIDRIYIQSTLGAANDPTDQVFLGFNSF